MKNNSLGKLRSSALLITCLLLCSCQKPSQEIWFEDLTGTDSKEIKINEAQVSQLVPWVFETGEMELNRLQVFDPDQQARIVFLSVSDGNAPAQVFLGWGLGWNQALANALAQFQRVRDKGFRPQGAKVDFVVQVERDSLKGWDDPFPKPLGLEGVAFKRGSEMALLPWEILSRALISEKGKIHFWRIQDYIRKNSTADKYLKKSKGKSPIPFFRFKTQSFYLSPSETAKLYRGHRFFKDPTTEDLLKAAKKGGDHLLGGLSPEGRYTYAYRADLDRNLKSYNILRHAGTTYSLLELYEATQDPRYLAGAERALKYLTKQVVTCPPKDPRLACVEEKGFIKLGGNGLAIIALAKYQGLTGDKKYLPLTRRLGNWIQETQQANGEFKPHKLSHPEGEPSSFVSEYYPGEAILALLRLYALDKDPKWLNTAEQAARYLILERDKEKKISQLPHDHWLLYGLEELYRYRPKALYREHARKITQAILSRQNHRPKYPDWLGSYYRPPRSTPTATRSEGLVAAYFLAEGVEDKKWQEKLLEGIRLGIDFQLQTQFQPESALYLIKPERALGGFHESLTGFEIRIDFTQHNISSLLGLRKILLKSQEGESKAANRKQKNGN